MCRFIHNNNNTASNPTPDGAHMDNEKWEWGTGDNSAKQVGNSSKHPRKGTKKQQRKAKIAQKRALRAQGSCLQNGQAPPKSPAGAPRSAGFDMRHLSDELERLRTLGQNGDASATLSTPPLNKLSRTTAAKLGLAHGFDVQVCGSGSKKKQAVSFSFHGRLPVNNDVIEHTLAQWHAHVNGQGNCVANDQQRLKLERQHARRVRIQESRQKSKHQVMAELKAKSKLWRRDDEQVVNDNQPPQRSLERRQSPPSNAHDVDVQQPAGGETDWEQFSTGFGRKLLAKCGWEEGQGLGKNEDGIREPIQQARREDKQGLGASG